MPTRIGWKSFGMEDVAKIGLRGYVTEKLLAGSEGIEEGIETGT
jgi:hypothetical protein